MRPRDTLGSAFGDDVVAEDPAMLRVLEMARTLGRHRAAVLITGETGSGKEVVARIVHRNSCRNSRPWVDVNCAALPEHLVESELFGHEKGAFSGAEAAKPGLFEMANGGTLFLDEIGEIDPRVQVKLLRVLDSAPFYRLGGTRKVSVDVRLIAATNRNLEAAVQAGTFRRDLYHRISEFQIAVPPLRNRPLDTIALAGQFLAQIRPDQRFHEDALEALSRMKWPGNVRELRNFVTKLGISVQGELISADELLRLAQGDPIASSLAEDLVPERAATITELERQMILHTLQATGGNQSQAAQLLGMPRRTFCRKLNQFQITFGRRRGSSFPPPSARNCRAELCAPVEVTTSAGCIFTAQATDLSLGGIGLRSVPLPLQVADELALRFELPHQDTPVEAAATVAWYRPDGTAGAQFSHLAAATHDCLKRWISGNVKIASPPPDDKIHQQLTA